VIIALAWWGLDLQLREPSSVARINDLSEALYVEVQGDKESIIIYCKETSQDCWKKFSDFEGYIIIWKPKFKLVTGS
jgi:hypothetical protein